MRKWARCVPAMGLAVCCLAGCAATKRSALPTGSHAEVRNNLAPVDPTMVWNATDRSMPAAPKTALVGDGIPSDLEPAKYSAPAPAVPQMRAPTGKPTTTSSYSKPISDSDFHKVAEKLAATEPASALQFSFETFRNQYPQAIRSGKGRIRVSTGLLATVRSQEELAGVLSIQMAEAVLAEKRMGAAAPAMPLAPGLTANDVDRSNAMAIKDAQGVPADQTDALAAKILAASQFNQNLVGDARTRLQDWYAALPPAERAKRFVFGN